MRSVRGTDEVLTLGESSGGFMKKIILSVLFLGILLLCGCSYEDATVSGTFSDDVSGEIEDVFGSAVVIATPDEYGIDAGDLADGGYHIRITDGQAVIVSSDDAGANNAAVRLLSQFMDVTALASAGDMTVTVTEPEDIAIPSTVSSHMVIKRDCAVQIHGYATPGDTVYGTFRGEDYTETSAAVADDEGMFRLIFPEMRADSKGKTLHISTSLGGSAAFEDILAGDVWLITGQSNSGRELYRSMEFYGETELPISEDAPVRLYWQDPACKEAAAVITEAQKDANGTGWTISSETELKRFSALGAYFAEEYITYADVPVGLIQCSANGAYLTELMQPRLGAELGIDGRVGAYYDLMIAPFTEYSVTGVLLWQGESEAGGDGRYQVYSEHLCRYIGALREDFNDPALPVIQIQLPTYGTTGVEFWPEVQNVRMEQLYASEKMNGFELVSHIDSGTTNAEMEDWAHPKNKRPAGVRAARIALQYVLGFDEWDETRSPAPESASLNGGTITVNFKYTGKGLALASGTKPTGFHIRYSDGTKEQPVSAEIVNGDTIKFGYNTEKTPVAISYGDLIYTRPVAPNVVNSSGAQMAAFVTDVK